MQNMEHDFISGVLSEEELGNTMHVHEVESGFACQVRNWRSYDAISRAVLQRWSFPFLVDSGSLQSTESESTYTFKRQNCYRCSMNESNTVSCFTPIDIPFLFRPEHQKFLHAAVPAFPTCVRRLDNPSAYSLVAD